jgi:hypothetical protein
MTSFIKGFLVASAMLLGLGSVNLRRTASVSSLGGAASGGPGDQSVSVAIRGCHDWHDIRKMTPRQFDTVLAITQDDNTTLFGQYVSIGQIPEYSFQTNTVHGKTGGISEVRYWLKISRH